ncbi:MFS transporter [Vibrio sinaloensis]|uniref:MFS transporter n=1 Tax=Photobacterium sp. (strain ATCC 43367) TaxID=379097 RepID=UPI0035EC116B
MTQSALIARFSIHQALHWATTGLMVPVLVLLFQDRGLDLGQIGLVMAVWIGSTTLLELPLGGVADQVGRRKTYLCSLLVTAFGVTALLFSASFISIVFSAALLGAARAIYSGTLDAWFYDAYALTCGATSYHSALAKVNVWVTLGLAIGSLIGGYLPNIASDSMPWLASRFDVNLWLILIASVCMVGVTLWLIPEAQQRRDRSGKRATHCLFMTIRHALRDVMSHQVLRRVMQTILVFGMVLSGVENLWQPYLSQLLADDDQGTGWFGVIAALYFAMAALSSWFSVTFLAWFAGSHRNVLLVSRLCSAFALLVMAMSSNVVGFTISYLVFFFLFTLGENSQTVLIQDNTPSRYRSTMLSLSSLTVTAGGMMASLLLGYVAQHHGIAVSWTGVAIVLILSSLLFARLPRHQNGSFGSRTLANVAKKLPDQ